MWILDLAASVREARARLDLETDRQRSRALYDVLLTRYGCAKGALDALFRCGRIKATARDHIAEALLTALAVKVIKR